MHDATSPFLLLPCLLIMLCLNSCSRSVMELSADFQDPLAHHKFSCVPFDSLEVRRALPILEAEYGRWLDCPKVYRAEVLAALSFYPDLKGVRIKIVQRPLKTSMAARPGNYAVVRSKRRYRIFVDDVTDKVTDFRRYPYSARIGCFIHELGHVAYYETRSNARLTYDGVNYVSRQKFRTRYEQYADHNAIARGGGFYGHMFRHHTLNEADISPEYREFKRDNYYTGKTLLDLHNAARREQGLPACDRSAVE
ncbi:hypothetical protein [Lewinella sp. 4G2]|uniref:hypothetical protein n=1 Tax=Lewinella sp. 4G2 TaxID=1803372 RepID=UPI0007B47182|nr:hypothetical protein [Lewinella sp. 4G2]OAV42594.1 hypothetical protein A3850_015215 [Lewinella sp. 4G2]